MSTLKDTDLEKIVSFLNGRLTLPEMEELKSIILNSEGGRETFEIMREIWLSTSELTPDGVFDKDEAWTKLKGKLK
jgi:hypothetical protein